MNGALKQIVLFGAGKSSTCLIDYLIKACNDHNWKLIVADSSLEQANSKIGKAACAQAISLKVENEVQRTALIEVANIVISLLPPDLHFLVAKDCLNYGKNLLTASYTDDAIHRLRPDIEKKGLLFLCEMGLDPGIDHMSAMQLIHTIKEEGGLITSFKSHCGGLIAPENDDNPWHYKISWNPRNVVMAGKAGAMYKENNELKNIPYKLLFEDCQEVSIDGLANLAYYPNRDSLSYIPVYDLENAHTFIRTTLRYPVFCAAWNWIVQADLTDDRTPLNVQGLTFKQWSRSILPYITETNEKLFDFLGFFSDVEVPATAKTSADILQYLLETKLAMQTEDKDMIVMLHEIDYVVAGKKHQVKSSLIVKGEDSIRTAMAKTVGLPLGIAAKLILLDEIRLTGLYIPIIPEIYEPVMKELATQGIIFNESYRD